MLSTRYTLRSRDTYGLKVRGWEKVFSAHGNQKKDRVTIFISKKETLKYRWLENTKDAA